MKPSEQDQLLREILAGEEVADFREVSLTRGLAYLKARRRRTLIAQSCVLAILPIVLALLLAAPRRVVPSATHVAMQLPSPPKIKLISDEELFALFPNRSMALIGPRGDQQLVFLDDGRAPAQP